MQHRESADERGDARSPGEYYRGPNSGFGGECAPGDCRGRTSGRRDDQADVAHRPVRLRSARMIASGWGGQPGTCTSTGTTSATAPATPSPPFNNPQSRAQSGTTKTYRPA